MAENREYKSDVFSMLLEDKNNALQVYNALNGSSYEDPEQVEIVSLESGMSLSIRNDAAFIVDMNLSIYEHQSTYNPNMPLRSLIYFASYLKKIVGKRDLYSPRMILIPTPHFAVFYNGLSERPAKETIRLSASYEKPTDQPELELECTVYNINPGKDQGLLSICSVLDEYTQFVEAVRRFDSDDPEVSVKKAIDYCISNHILEEFLRKRWTEVLKAMTIDMTFERREELLRHEEREIGRAEGLAEGRAEGREEGRAEGLIQGRDEAVLENIKSIMKTMNYTADQAMEILSIAVEDRPRYLSML